MSVQVTNKDLVLLGHGSYPGGATNTKLPSNVDLYILQPVGYSLLTTVASELIDQERIDQLELHHENDSGTSIIEPAIGIYKGGESTPNLTLYNLGGLEQWGVETIGDKQNVVTVNETTLLSELLTSNTKILDAINKLAKDETLKLYWSACLYQTSENYASLV